MFIHVYGPNKDEYDKFELLKDFLLEKNGHNFIIGGDFNTILNYSLEKKNGRLDTNRKSETHYKK